MLRKISARALAMASLAMLILVTLLYYTEEFFFPGHVFFFNFFFMGFGRFVGSVFFALMIVAVIALSISAFRLVFRHKKGS